MVQLSWPRWPPCPYMVKTLKKSSSLTQKRPMTFKLGIPHWVLKCYQVCSNDDPGWRSESKSELLLVTRQNDNHSPGPGPGRLVPSSHQRSELSNTISRHLQQRVCKCIPVPNCLGGKATLINISVSNGNLICHRMIIPAAPNQGDKVFCWYTGFTLQTFV